MAKPKEILVCMKCGSGNLNSNPGGVYSAQTAYGMSGAMTGQALCNKCGNFGFPVLLVREKGKRAHEKYEDKPDAAGRKNSEAPKRGSKNPYLAAFVSMVIPGAGQAYNGNLKKAIVVFLLVGPGSLILFVAGEVLSYELFGSFSFTALILPFLLWLANILDAYFGAKGKELL